MILKERVNILGVGIDNVTRVQVLQNIERLIQSGIGYTLSFANPEILMQARRKPQYRKFLEDATLVVADGIGLVWASKILGEPLPERITGTDFMEDIAALSDQKGYRLYFVGGEPGIAEQAAENLRQKYPRVNIVGSNHGYFSKQEEAKILSDIKGAHPDILVVCLGMYRQEMWIRKHKATLGVPICLGNGGALDFAAGKLKRAPIWMMRWGFEWLYRLILQPRRILRQLNLPYFVFLVFASRIGLFGDSGTASNRKTEPRGK